MSLRFAKFSSSLTFLRIKKIISVIFKKALRKKSVPTFERKETDKNKKDDSKIKKNVIFHIFFTT